MTVQTEPHTKLTVGQLQKELEVAAQHKRTFSCSHCKWVGMEPLLVDYDDRGPHLECPACRQEIQVLSPASS